MCIAAIRPHPDPRPACASGTSYLGRDGRQDEVGRRDCHGFLEGGGNKRGGDVFIFFHSLAKKTAPGLPPRPPTSTQRGRRSPSTEGQAAARVPPIHAGLVRASPVLCFPPWHRSSPPCSGPRRPRCVCVRERESGSVGRPPLPRCTKKKHARFPRPPQLLFFGQVKTVAFHPVLPWLAFADVAGTVVVWDWEADSVREGRKGVGKAGGGVRSCQSFSSCRPPPPPRPPPFRPCLKKTWPPPTTAPPPTPC